MQHLMFGNATKLVNAAPHRWISTCKVLEEVLRSWETLEKHYLDNEVGGNSGRSQDDHRGAVQPDEAGRTADQEQSAERRADGAQHFHRPLHAAGYHARHGEAAAHHGPSQGAVGGSRLSHGSNQARGINPPGGDHQHPQNASRRHPQALFQQALR